MKTSERKSRSRLLRRVLSLLERKLGRRRRRRRPDPLETVLHAVLAGDGNDLAAMTIIQRLREDLVDWNELRVTTPRAIEELISSLPDAAEKAHLVKRVLRKLFLEHHSLSLNHLKRYGQARIWAELEAFGGMTAPMKARVLLKAFDFNVLPVTSDIERLTKRLGLVESYLTRDKVEEGIAEILPPKRIYSFYHLMSEQAETVCTLRNYACTECVLVGLCARGRSVKDRKGDQE